MLQQQYYVEHRVGAGLEFVFCGQHRILRLFFWTRLITSRWRNGFVRSPLPGTKRARKGIIMYARNGRPTVKQRFITLSPIPRLRLHSRRAHFGPFFQLLRNSAHGSIQIYFQIPSPPSPIRSPGFPVIHDLCKTRLFSLPYFLIR